VWASPHPLDNYFYMISIFLDCGDRKSPLKTTFIFKKGGENEMIILELIIFVTLISIITVLCWGKCKEANKRRRDTADENKEAALLLKKIEELELKKKELESLKKEIDVVKELELVENQIKKFREKLDKVN